MKICKEWTLIVDNLKIIFMKDIMQQLCKNKLRNWILLNTLMKNSMQVIYKSLITIMNNLVLKTIINNWVNFYHLWQFQQKILKTLKVLDLTLTTHLAIRIKYQSRMKQHALLELNKNVLNREKLKDKGKLTPNKCKKNLMKNSKDKRGL